MLTVSCPACGFVSSSPLTVEVVNDDGRCPLCRWQLSPQDFFDEEEP